MGLSCDCGGGGEDYDFYYIVEDNERFACSERLCYGCYGHIHVGDEVRRVDEIEIEYDQYVGTFGTLCPVCSGLYDSLTELGFCITADWGFITESMEQYREMNS